MNRNSAVCYHEAEFPAAAMSLSIFKEASTSQNLPYRKVDNAGFHVFKILPFKSIF